MTYVKYENKEYYVYAVDIYNRCQKFFEKRFNRKFIPNKDSYAQEWLERFFKGVPDYFMDSQSLEIYLDIIKEGRA